MKQVGKRGRMNAKARKMIARISEYSNLISCEAKLLGCMGDAHHPAHRKKRVEYRTAEELADVEEWIGCCQACHSKLESDEELTKKVFMRARGEMSNL